MSSTIARIKPRLTYANVISTIALFVVMGGGAYATIDGKIVAKDIKKAAVTTPKIKGQAVKTGKIADKAVTAQKLADGVAVSGPLGPQGEQGPQGPQGPPGPSTGPAGGDLTGNYPNPLIAPNAIGTGEVANNSLTGADIDETTLGALTAGLQVVTQRSALDSTSPKTVAPECPAGKRYILGGFDISAGKTGALPNQYSDVVLDQMDPSADGRRIFYTAYEEEPHAGNWQLDGSVLCINAP